jgi:hypothetical protein
VKSRRATAALAYAGAAFLFGMALGERGELGAVQYFFLAGIPAATAILAYFAKSARVEVLVGGLAMFAGVVAGRAEFERAWDECFAAAPQVRAKIDAHFEEHGEYPQRLDDPPCRCMLRGTILHYAYNERGYRLWFTNDFQTVSATGKSSNRSRTTPPSTP